MHTEEELDFFPTTHGKQEIKCEHDIHELMYSINFKGISHIWNGRGWLYHTGGTMCLNRCMKVLVSSTLQYAYEAHPIVYFNGPH